MIKNKKIFLSLSVVVILVLGLLYFFNQNNTTYYTQDNITVDEVEGKVLIYAADSCPYCVAIKDDLNKFLKTNNNNGKVVLIDLENENSKEFIEKYPVEYIPSAYSVKKDKELLLIDNDGNFEEDKLLKEILNEEENYDKASN